MISYLFFMLVGMLLMGYSVHKGWIADRELGSFFSALQAWGKKVVDRLQRRNDITPEETSHTT